MASQSTFTYLEVCSSDRHGGTLSATLRNHYSDSLNSGTANSSDRPVDQNREILTGRNNDQSDV